MKQLQHKEIKLALRFICRGSKYQTPEIQTNLNSKLLSLVFRSWLNKTGLQPVSRPVKQVHYFGGWVQGVKSRWCQGFADGQLNDCFLGKTSLAKNFQMAFRRMGWVGLQPCYKSCVAQVKTQHSATGLARYSDSDCTSAITLNLNFKNYGF